jgi:hypothetical protein
MLTAEALFTLFNRSCASCGASVYGGASFHRQSQQTQAAWQDFRKRLEAYWPPSSAKLLLYELSDENDYIAAVCDALDAKGQQKLYKHLYQLGHRINR